MRVWPVDERDSSWENDRPRFRVYLQDTPRPGYGSSTATYDIDDADVTEVIAWAESQVTEDMVYAVCLVHDDSSRGRGIVWLLGSDANAVDAPSGTVQTLALRVEADDLSRPDVQQLLLDHLADMHATSPAESVHALDIEGLRAAGISFWSAWHGEVVVGCGALKDLGQGDLELKSMRTSPSARGQGVGAAVLTFLIREARRRGARRILLETGTQPFFEPAHRLYERHGFRERGPFGDYVDDPNSRFYELALESGDD